MKKFFVMMLLALSITSNVGITASSINNTIDIETYEHAGNP